jgi:hypothetical protein
MYIVGDERGLSTLRKQLEFCYDNELLEEAILIGNILDMMQYFLLEKEHEKDTSRQPTYRLSFELIRV